MRTPAGRPCRVITISSSTASRRYFDKSSFISARATSRAALRWRPLLVEPRLGVRFRDDREDLDLRLCNVIEHPDVSDPQAILRLAHPPEPLDPTLADLCRLVRQVHVERLYDARPKRHRQILERPCSSRRKNDLKCHCGQILARFFDRFKCGCGFSGLTIAFTSGRSPSHRRPSGATRVSWLMAFFGVRRFRPSQ